MKNWNLDKTGFEVNSHMSSHDFGFKDIFWVEINPFVFLIFIDLMFLVKFLWTMVPFSCHVHFFIHN